MGEISIMKAAIRPPVLPEVASPVPGQDDRGDAEHGCRQPRREIARAEEKIGQGDQVKLQRPVHHRVVLIAVALVEQPREVGVQALVVAHDADAQVVEPGDDGQRSGWRRR